MARRSPKSPVPVVCEKTQSGCMCAWGLYSLFDFRQGQSNRKLLSDRIHLSSDTVGDVNLTSRLDLHTKFDEKCQGIDDRIDNKTQRVNSGKPIVKRLRKEELPAEQQTNKKIASADVEHRQCDSKLAGNLPTNHGKTSKTCQKSRHLPVHGRRSYGCKSISCVKHDHLKEINLQPVQRNEAEATRSQKFINGKYLSSDLAIHQSTQFFNALEILNSNKELFIELLQDPNSLLVKHIQDLRDSQSKGQQTKSLSGAKLLENLTSNARECEDSMYSKKLKSCDRYLPKGSGDPQPSDRIVVLKPGPTSMQKSSDRISHYSSQQSHDWLRIKGQSVRPALFSFDHIKRKLKHAMGVSRKEQQWMSVNGKLEKFPYDCQCSKAGGKRIGTEIVGRNTPSNVLFDIGGMTDSSLNVTKRDKERKAKDIEERIGHEAASTSESDHRNSNFSIVGHPKKNESNMCAVTRKHLSEMLNNGNVDNDILRKQVPKAWGRTFSFPDYDLLPTRKGGRDRELGFDTAQMRFSPYRNDQMAYGNKWQFQEEKKDICLSSLRQNIEALPSADTKKPNEPFQVLDKKPSISENHFADMKVEEDDMSPIGSAKIFKANDTIQRGETKSLEVPSKSDSKHRTHSNESTVTANTSEKIGHLESSRLNSSLENKKSKISLEVSSSSPSTIQRVEDSDSLKANAEQPSPVSLLEQGFTEDVTSSASNIYQPVELPVQAQQVNVGDHYSAAQERTLLDPKINITTSMDYHESFSEYISAVLQASGLNWEELPMKCHSPEQLLDQSLFDELKISNNQFFGDCVLLFDCINEVLAEVYQYNSGCSPWVSCIKPIIQPLLVEKTVVHEVIKRVDWHLFPHPRTWTLDGLVEQDLARSRTWLDIHTETEDIAIQTAEGVLEELLTEIVLELYI